MQKRWIYKEIPPREQVDGLMSSVGLSQLTAFLLAQRQIDNFDSAKKFFRPLLENLHNPFLMKDMDKAVQRIQKAIDQKEKIIIYGDYDVDGTTSVALIYSFFSCFYSNIRFYIPDRNSEGYGVSMQAINWAHQENASLIITLDCGIKDHEAIRYAASFNIECIVCDHHIPVDELPCAIAILNPKQIDCNYPYKELSGCGVGFKLIQAFSQKNNLPFERVYDLLDLVAVSIASDIVPITGENRILMYHGLLKLNTNPCVGLKALINIAGLKTPLDVTKVVFGLAPRINAAGRLKHATEAVELLLSTDEQQASELATVLNDRNAMRKEYDSTMTDEALSLIESNTRMKEAKSTVLFKQDWHKGVIGIVASRCIEKYYRPTIILTESNQKAVGSARSVQGFDIYQAIFSCADLLERFGGHQYAAGLTLDLDRVDELIRRFEQIVSDTIKEECLTPCVEVDSKIKLQSINSKFYKILEQMAPFGPGNTRPIFVAENVFCIYPPRILKEQHLKLIVKQEDSQPFEVIGFGMAHLLEIIRSRDSFHLCFSIHENNFQGESTLQLMIKDIK